MPDALTPPARFADASFETYRPQNDAQAEALVEARQLTERIRARYTEARWKRWLRSDSGLRHGLYLVGPVGTGKTHLLVSIYRALEPAVPCAFLHSKQLFRATEPPAAYAERLAARHRVVLLDEVELDDPANEVRLINVLKTLNRLGVTVAATSNAEPDKFVSAQFGRDRLERFISEEFRKTYHVVFVRGEDYRRRLARPGRAWIGPRDAAEAALRARYDADPGPKRWLPGAELLRLTVETERTALAEALAATERLYLPHLDVIDSTDDALRLLRVVDDLYDRPAPPTLFYSAETPPEAWFTPDDAGSSIARGIAEKFARTVSRLHALCAVESVGRAA